MNRVVRLLPGGEVALGIAAIGRGNVQRIVAVDVALAALHRRVLIRERETGGAVIKFSVSPRRDRMARRAGSGSGRKAGGNVIRDVAANRGCALPSRSVAAHAIRGIQCVIAVDVARRASRRCRRHVRTDECETGRTVIELSVGPRRDRMARCARSGGRWETRGDVVRNIAPNRRRALPRRLMAAHAIGGIERVIVVDMARSARSRCRRHVRARKREPRDAVIEGSRIPTFGRVAIRTVSQRESRTCC